MSIPDGRYKSLVEYGEIGAGKKKNVSKKAGNKDDDGESKDNASTVADEDLEKDKEKELSSRARVMARDDYGLFLIGSIGAVLSGLVYPGWGVVFAFMIELFFHPVFPCDDSSGSFTNLFDNKTYKTCQEYWDYEADTLKVLSIDVTYAWLGLIASTVFGNMLLFYGFGAATERMNKRIRDSIFVSLMRQDVGYYDTHSITNLSTKIEDDAAMMHSFSGEPIRQVTLTVASVVVGLVISFIYMW